MARTRPWKGKVRGVHLTAREWAKSRGVPPQVLVKFRGVYVVSPKAKERRFPTADSGNKNMPRARHRPGRRWHQHALGGATASPPIPTMPESVP